MFQKAWPFQTTGICNLLEEEPDNGLGLGGLVSFPDAKSDPYLAGRDEDEESDIEDFKIKPTDNLLLAGHVEGSASILEVYGKCILLLILNIFCIVLF